MILILTAFKARGGKLIQYHGWNDQQISAQNSINYYERVVGRTGSAQETEEFYRLFMVPGMNHCAGGQGPDSLDSINAIEQWVEQGRAPSRIIASRAVGGQIERTRPLCPYPQVVVYKGTGSTNDAENFACKTR
jgi:feruloyl esterase